MRAQEKTSEEVHSLALRNTLNEIKNVCPDVQTAFIFKQNGPISAKDDDSKTETVANATETFNVLAEKAETLGSLESVTFYGAQNRMHISQMNDSYLATVASQNSDEKYINTLTRVLVPMVSRIVESLNLDSRQEQVADDELESSEDETESSNETETYQEEISEQETTEADSREPELEEETADLEQQPESDLPEPPATQFMVEHLGGLLVPSDTVRIDNAVILQWKELYGDIEITEVDLESLNGQTTRCKFKPIRDSKQEGKGVIQMPKKIQFTLQLSKGELVMVKPVIDWRGTTA